MRHLFAYISVFLLVACADNKLSSIEGTIEVEKCNVENTWIYLYTINHNDYYIADSCLVTNNRFRLTSNLSHERRYMLLAPAGKAEYQFRMCPGDRLKIDITKQMRSHYLIIPESYPTMAAHVIHEDILANGKKWRRLSDSLVLMDPQTPEYVQLKNSIDAFNHYRNVQRLLEFLDDERVKDSPSNCDDLMSLLQHDGLPKRQLDSLKTALLKRFPHDHEIMPACTGVPAPPMSREGFVAMNRIRTLMNMPPVEEFCDETERGQRLSDSYVKPEPYKLGEIVDKDIFRDFDLTFPDIRSDYVLVDFWASWCAPCCEQIPEVLKTKTKYGDLLTVYAVSLDYHAEHWQKALARYGIEKQFVNIMLPRKHERYQYILDKFDVSAIPANFLLDKERWIVAINLHGDELVEKIEELSSK